MLENLFKLKQLETSFRTEFLAGITTFLTMSYIIFVNPAILGETGMDSSAVFVATCLAAAVGSITMGLIANYPLGLAPGMGLNAFFTYGIVMGMGLTWQQALGAVFVSGIVFAILSILPVREAIINSIPNTLKMAIATGIGLFLAIIGFKNAGLIVDHPATLVSLGNIKDLKVIFSLLGIILTAGLYARKIKGSIIISILFITILSILTGISEFGGIISIPPSIAPTFLKMQLPDLFTLSTVTLIVSLLLVDMFDTAGTLIGTAYQGNLLDSNGKLPRLRNALLADSTATIVGAGLGTSTTTTYIESVSGIAAGGRSGLTAVTIGILFLIALFFAPLASTVPPHATAPALIFIACLMAKSVRKVNWDDITDYTPSVLTIVTMPLSFSITNGIGIGFISYTTIKIIAGRYKEIKPVMWVLALVFIAKYTLLQV